MRLLSRALFWCVGLIFAIPAGAVALLIGATVEPAAGDLLGNLGLTGLEAFLDALFGVADPALALDLAVGLLTAAAVLLIVPPALVALIGEVLSLRSFAWYGGACGGLTAALPWLLRARFDPAQAVFPAEGRLTALLFLTGAVSGLVYWLVAGRSAGHPLTPPHERGERPPSNTP